VGPAEAEVALIVEYMVSPEGVSIPHFNSKQSWNLRAALRMSLAHQALLTGAKRTKPNAKTPEDGTSSTMEPSTQDLDTTAGGGRNLEHHQPHPHTGHLKSFDLATKRL
jgi:hypothetical protein